MLGKSLLCCRPRARRRCSFLPLDPRRAMRTRSSRLGTPGSRALPSAACRASVFRGRGRATRPYDETGNIPYRSPPPRNPARTTPQPLHPHRLVVFARSAGAAASPYGAGGGAGVGGGGGGGCSVAGVFSSPSQSRAPWEHVPPVVGWTRAGPLHDLLVTSVSGGGRGRGERAEAGAGVGAAGARVWRGRSWRGWLGGWWARPRSRARRGGV